MSNPVNVTTPDHRDTEIGASIKRTASYAALGRSASGGGREMNLDNTNYGKDICQQ
jgi:hypothetical protein